MRSSRVRLFADLVAFEAGCLVFAAWMAGTEGIHPVNHDSGCCSE